MKCSKIAALLLLPVLLCTAGCSVKSGILSGYEKVISAMGTLTPTPDAALNPAERGIPVRHGADYVLQADLRGL